MDPKISIVMPVWNGEKYLREAVESILTKQAFADFELIAIDDGSADSTPEILKSYADPRLRVFRRNHGGLVEARNFAVAMARSEWIACQDADDACLPGRLECLWMAANRNERPVVIYSDVKRIIEDGTKVKPTILPTSRALLALKMCFQCPITQSTVMFHKPAFERVGGYLAEEYYAEDFGLWIRMLEVGPFVGLKGRLVRFREHASSFTKNLTEPQFEVARAMAVRHCRKFFALSDAEARRVFQTLRQFPRDRSWKEWRWFLTKCVPHARWKSIEMYAWVASQTARMLAGR